MMKTSELLDTNYTMAKEIFQEKKFPWEVLPKICKFILEIGPSLRSEFVEVLPQVWVHNTAEVAASASLVGPTIIDEGTKIRHCAFIRGSVIVGKRAVVGNSVELKNCILFDGAQAPHYNYVGDSILGRGAHLGAGVITSNVKSDKSLVSVIYGDERIATNLRKFGAIVGDFAEVGCSAVLNPGTVLGRESTVYPLCAVRGTVPAKHIFKRAGVVVQKI